MIDSIIISKNPVFYKFALRIKDDISHFFGHSTAGIRNLTIISCPLPVSSAFGNGLTMYPLASPTEKISVTNKTRILASTDVAVKESG